MNAFWTNQTGQRKRDYEAKAGPFWTLGTTETPGRGKGVPQVQPGMRELEARRGQVRDQGSHSK